ncbi:MAG: hypothetical protein J0I84_12990 [Terrimonas sp.]|nr:hypothetical protein [Terrimonas sp.]OJY88685.1 MAG: hypothetical protein BGP13_17425 [Sphingobacteriales bacterium 40-81]
MIAIPAFHAASKGSAKGGAKVYISSRTDSSSSGIFTVKVSAVFDPATNDYPTGTVLIDVNLSDSTKGAYKSTSIELINAYGRSTPTIYITGKCKISTQERTTPTGLRFWLMITDNKTEARSNGTPDIIAFTIHDRAGNRIAYGAGPVKEGDISVEPSGI